MKVKEQLKAMQRSSILINIAGQTPYKAGGSRFGGQPDIPPDFIWPTFTGTNAKGAEQNHPLAFLAQFNCEELADFDTEGLLPKHGILSFFYEPDSMTWGFDPKDKGSARVFWFEDTAVLTPANFPADLENDFKLPQFLRDWDFDLNSTAQDFLDNNYIGYELEAVNENDTGSEEADGEFATDDVARHLESIEEKAMRAAAEQYAFCPDTVEQSASDATICWLADTLRQSKIWYFWWG